MSIRFQLRHDRALNTRYPINAGLDGAELAACNLVRAAIISRECWRRHSRQAVQANFFGGSQIASDFRSAAHERRSVMRQAALWARQFAGQISATDPRIARKAAA